MISNIIESLSGELTNHLTQKTGISSAKVSDSVIIAKDDIVDSLKSEAASGNINGLLDLFRGKQAVGSNPIVMNIINKYAGSLITKLGLPETVSRAAATYIIPFIFNQFISRTKSSSMKEGELFDLLGSEVGGFSFILKNGLGDELNKSFKDKFTGFLGSRDCT